MKTRILPTICGLIMFMPLVSLAQELDSNQAKKKSKQTTEFNPKKEGIKDSLQILEEMTVSVIRAGSKTPTTYSNMDRKEIESKNFGQDLPYLLNTLPSTVVTSDAGAGVGYSGIRIRGVDPTRTNVTINGIPVNDSESHGVYWVNMPDFASSVDNIQVQRGVGTSSNGASAFGASINIKTNSINRKAYGTLDNSYGSFNTWKNTVKAGTGLINGKFTLDTRLSRISSAGYIDRAKSNLKSYYLSGSWHSEKSLLRATVFSGKEKTYQAWYGTPESVMNGNQAEIAAYADRNWISGSDRDNLLTSGRTYNHYTYENEVDNYQQDHYQLHFNHAFSHKLKLTSALHYTRGKGYYEQYKADEDLVDYGFSNVILPNDTVTSTDLIRRRWLDNHFYGGVFSLSYDNGPLNLIFGGGANQYIGGHYGEVIWAEFASNSEIRDRYYDNEAQKFEAHSYLKGSYKKGGLTIYGDIQYRHIDYSFLGIDDVSGTIKAIDQTLSFDFINPKAGFMYDFNKRNNTYVSVAVANREPVRRDFRESTPENRPKVEQLINLEAGYRYKGNQLMVNANAYYMHYNDQLVLTGQINDVGGYTRTNVDVSRRVGLELEAGYRITKKLSVTGNLTLSDNKIKEFNEYVTNYDIGGQDTIIHTNSDLAFSPNIIAAAGVKYEPLKGLSISLLGKHVGRQFLDNTSTDSRSLDAYTTFNVQVNYTIKDVLFKEMTVGLLVNNVANKMYANNGYTWGYIAGNERTVENFYYPQAGRNFLVRVLLKF
ncbi:MAG: TonB-dependent receptor [Crocinitomicaceae bacterium]|nr:TonB-dependent receptor [Crocinitomicaceae bacterium]MDG1776067.1 TonB-dependent receptor [Crocinitomicaceae bacterium]